MSRRIWIPIIGVLLVLMVPLTSVLADPIGDVRMDNFILVGLSRVENQPDGASTWVYRLREHPHSGDLRFWLLEVQDCIDVIDFPGGEWVEEGAFTGVRWVVDPSFNNGTFSLVVRGTPDYAAVTALAVADASARALIDGPACLPAATATFTPTFTPIATQTTTQTAIPTVTQTATPTVMPTAQPTVTPTITVIPNRAPLAGTGSFSTLQDQPLTVNVLALAFDPDGDPLVISNYQAVSDSNGQVTYLDGGTPNDPSDDRLRYMPAPGFSGTDRFTYTVSDGSLSGQGVVTVMVLPTNTPRQPVPAPDSYTLTGGGSLSVPAPGVLANDDLAGLVVSAVLERSVSSGTVVLSSNGAFIYTPLSGFNGSDSFSYRLVTSNFISQPVEVSLWVADQTAPRVTWVQPVAAEQRYDLPLGSSVILRVEVQDDTPGVRVIFRRWDAPTGLYITIGELSAPPYQLQVPAEQFNDAWNQVNAEAIDGAGNVSESPFIWIYRTSEALFEHPFKVFITTVWR